MDNLKEYDPTKGKNEEKQKERKKLMKIGSVAFLVGGGIGAVTGILFVPRKGRT
ncbi:YtxH domain-containing protein [Pseudalkalibacillus caeni]|uniref:YtxH domain-containing protein n=1 Tax=Exobacillus caeni TaxID=2574798 RepID=UPI001485A7A0|nr:YtxH domain-containing protein [Pseudalkalibacillus caeni]